MNCDQVFEILTRGPFPTGTPCDPPVEAHLSTCSECRRLAEALRPALELFQEAVGPEESRDLPGYWCAVATERSQPVASVAKDVELSSPVEPSQNRAPLVKGFPSKHWSAAAAWRLAAMLVLGVTLGAVVGSRGTFRGLSGLPPSRGGATVAAAAPAPQEPRERHLTLAQWQTLAALPAACFGNRPEAAQRYTVTNRNVLANAELDNLDCCTDCHNSQSDKVPGNATASVAQSCQFCH